MKDCGDKENDSRGDTAELRFRPWLKAGPSRTRQPMGRVEGNYKKKENMIFKPNEKGEMSNQKETEVKYGRSKRLNMVQINEKEKDATDGLITKALLDDSILNSEQAISSILFWNPCHGGISHQGVIKRCCHMKMIEDLVWRYTGFYGYLEESNKQLSWNLLSNLNNQFELPWLCGGDFNEIMDETEKKGEVAEEVNQFFLSEVL